MPGTRGAAILLLVVVVLSFGCATMSAPESIESLLQQAKELLDAKKYDEALTKITEVIRRDPAQWKAYLYGAQAYIGKLDWSAALANARKAFELAPSDATVVTILGESLLGGGADAAQARRLQRRRCPAGVVHQAASDRPAGLSERGGRLPARPSMDRRGPCPD